MRSLNGSFVASVLGRLKMGAQAPRHLIHSERPACRSRFSHNWLYIRPEMRSCCEAKEGRREDVERSEALSATQCTDRPNCIAKVKGVKWQFCYLTACTDASQVVLSKCDSSSKRTIYTYTTIHHTVRSTAWENNARKQIHCKPTQQSISIPCGSIKSGKREVLQKKK